MRKAFLLLALLLAAAGASARALVQLDAPSLPVLDGGAHAVVAWKPAGPLPAEVEEWEAFLSVDGGRHYAVRITPHLDANIRSFTFDVPNVAASDARILIRLGDEHEERIVHLPQSFTIVPGFVRAEVLDARATEHEGESALFDGDRVREWVSGDFVTQRHHDREELEPAAVSSDVSCDALVAPSVAKARAHRPRIVTLAAPQIHEEPAVAPHPISRDTLLLTTRLNV